MVFLQNERRCNRGSNFDLLHFLNWSKNTSFTKHLINHKVIKCLNNTVRLPHQ